MLVDDHPLVRQGIKKILEQEPDIEVISEVASADEALATLSHHDPHILIIDISIEGKTDGIELVKILKKDSYNVKTLMLSMHDEAAYIERAMKAGADGYVAKKDPSSFIIDAVRTILNGDMYLSTSVSGKVINKLMNVSRNKTEDYKGLSERELEIFSLIGQGFVTGEIAKELGLSVNTVESHRRHIKEKLSLEKGSDILKAAIEYRVQNKSVSVKA